MSVSNVSDIQVGYYPRLTSVQQVPHTFMCSSKEQRHKAYRNDGGITWDS
jgi:hypothetical protein